MNIFFYNFGYLRKKYRGQYNVPLNRVPYISVESVKKRKEIIINGPSICDKTRLRGSSSRLVFEARACACVLAHQLFSNYYTPSIRSRLRTCTIRRIISRKRLNVQLVLHVHFPAIRPRISMLHGSLSVSVSVSFYLAQS